MEKRGIDSYIRDFVLEYLNAIVIIFLLLASMVIRFHLMNHGTSSDFVTYFDPWVKQYKKSIVLGLREGVGDYYIPYNVLLALASLINIPTKYSVGAISCAFDYLTCIYIYKILEENFSGELNRTAIKIISVSYLFVPTVLLDGAAWKQCDSIFSFFLVVLIKCLLDGKIRTAFVMFGIAFSFKQQAIFIIPLMIIMYFMNKKMKIVYLLYSVLVYLLAGVPAIVMGRPALEVYTIYFRQIAANHKMTHNYPNIYMIAMTDYEKCHIYAKLFTVFVFALVFIYIVSRFKALSKKSILVLAAWSIWTACMFLPAMHQRYDYMVAILWVVCLPLFVNDHFRIAAISAVLFYVGNIITYSYSLFGDDYNSIFVMCCNVTAYILFGYLLWNCLSGESKENIKCNL